MKETESDDFWSKINLILYPFLGNLTTQIAIIVIIFILLQFSMLSVFELLKWHTYIIVSSNGLKLQSLSRNMLHLRSKTHAAS